MILTDTVDRSVVNKKFQEHIKVQFTQSLFVIVNVFWEPDLILHVLDFFLSRVKAHATHHVGNSFKGYLAIKFSRFCCVFIFGSDLWVVEEIFEVTHDLTIWSSFKKLREGVLIGAVTETFGQDWKINFPHVDAQILTSGSKEKLSINQRTDTGYFRRMGN